MKIMKTINCLLLVLISIIILSPFKVSAQTTPIPNVPTPTIKLQIGIDCGDMTAKSPSNKCCAYKPIPNDPFKKQGIPLVDQIIDLLNVSYKEVFAPVFKPIEETVQSVVQPCISGSPSTPGDLTNSSCICIEPTPGPLTSLSKFCNAVSPNEKSSCNTCISIGGIWTATGCIYPNVKDFIEKTVLGFSVGLAGMVALLCIIYAAIRLQTSQGNPENIKKAQELLTSCIMGLMLIIFSVFILRLIGVDILKIPGFSK